MKIFINLLKLLLLLFFISTDLSATVIENSSSSKQKTTTFLLEALNEKNEAIGYSIFYTSDRDTAWLSSIHVEEAFRNKGIGSFLFRKTMYFLSLLDSTRIKRTEWLSRATSNVPNAQEELNRFYTHLGGCQDIKPQPASGGCFFFFDHDNRECWKKIKFQPPKGVHTKLSSSEE